MGDVWALGIDIAERERLTEAKVPARELSQEDCKRGRQGLRGECTVGRGETHVVLPIHSHAMCPEFVVGRSGVGGALLLHRLVVSEERS